MLLHRLMLKENYSSQKKDPGIAVFQSVRVRGVSPVLVFFRYQFKLHCIHHEVVGKMGFLGLWTKSPYNNGSPGVWTEAGAPWDGDDSVTKSFLIMDKAPETK